MIRVSLHGFLFGQVSLLPFFSPIFNIADASISAGILTIFVFQKKFFGTSDRRADVKTEKLLNEELPVS